MGSVGSGLGEGNADSLFKFDLNVERGTLKMSNSDIQHDLNGDENEIIVTEPPEGEGHKKKKKKKNKDKDTERKEEKKKSKRNKESDSFDREYSVRHEKISEHFNVNEANFNDEDQEIQVDIQPPNNDWDVNVTPPPLPRHNIEISNNWKSKSMGV